MLELKVYIINALKILMGVKVYEIKRGRDIDVFESSRCIIQNILGGEK